MTKSRRGAGWRALASELRELFRLRRFQSEHIDFKRREADPEGCAPPQEAPKPIRQLTDRHAEVQDWWISGEDQPAGLVGLAFSGGGIRSATFSLGVAQALAIRGKFSAIDVLSTVSGGSYIGCFLRSLFLPRRLRGIAQPTVSVGKTTSQSLEAELEAQRDFAERALASAAGDKRIDGPGSVGQVCNPMWWLREHSRYLAPNGPGDFTYAAAYIVRNWISLLWVFSIGIAVLLLFVSWLELTFHRYAYAGYAAIEVLGAKLTGITLNPANLSPVTSFGQNCLTAADRCAALQPVSVLIPMALFPLVAALGAGAAYWLTVRMSANEPVPERQVRNFRAVVGWTALSALVPAAPVLLSRQAGASWLAWLPGAPTGPLPGLAVITLDVTIAAIALEIAAGLIGFAVARTKVAPLDERNGWSWLAKAASVIGNKVRGLSGRSFQTAGASRGRQLLSSELRLLLTQRLAFLLGCTLLLIGLGVVETLAAYLRALFWKPVGFSTEIVVGTGGLLPLLAYGIKKAQDWTKDGKLGGRLFSFAKRFLPAAAATIGVVLFSAVAVAVDAVILAGAWDGAAWIDTPDLSTFLALSLAVSSLAVLTGRSEGFINLSSWHSFYASRLTRAYLGASNVDRLQSLADDTVPDSTIRDNHVLDYIQPAIYASMPLPAPLHIINMTVNRTVNPKSQFGARDRRGEPASVEPDGVHVGTPLRAGSEDLPPRSLLNWEEIGDAREAENLSLGQWCAISGAAVSTGMGRRTNIGYALLTSFANVRLGYWWHAPALLRTKTAMAAGSGEKPNCFSRAKSRIALLADRWANGGSGPTNLRPVRMLPTFTYLRNELTARYSREHDRQYLSDGGHFENTAAYHLVRRRLPVVIICDNGEDADYTFGDLEHLVRVVRLDQGIEITLLRGPALATLRQTVGCHSLDIFVDPAVSSDWRSGMKSGTTRGFVLAFETCGADGRKTHMVLIKPRLLPDLAEDVLGFARANPDFPQQTTGDQFFGEAQWESYRRLGETLAGRLLDACPRLFPLHS